MKDVIEVLRQPGAIAVIPTDTVYGVVARASDQQAVARLYELKHRHQKPGTLIAASIEQLVKLGVPRRYLTAVEQFWPGAVSVVVPTSPELDYLSLGQHSLAIRIPSNPELQSVLSHVGPLLTSSANHPGQSTATTAEQARTYFGNKVDHYQVGEDLSGHEPSTVIRVVDDAIEVLREGAVKIDESGRIHS